MLKKSFHFLLIGAFLLSVIACTATQTRESTGEYFDNTMITTKVKTEFLKDEQIKSLPITVKSYKGTVQLSGFVDNQKLARRAENIAASVKGVKGVENNLIVK